MIIRKPFSQVYAFESPKTGKYWLVSARRDKWGRRERKTFPKEELALKYARDLEAQIVENGKQPDIPKEEDPACRLVRKTGGKAVGSREDP